MYLLVPNDLGIFLKIREQKEFGCLPIAKLQWKLLLSRKCKKVFQHVYFVSCSLLIQHKRQVL